MWQCKWRHLVSNINLKLYQLKKIIQVLNSIPWVRCASGNVYFIKLEFFSPLHLRKVSFKAFIQASETFFLSKARRARLPPSFISSRETPPSFRGGGTRFSGVKPFLEIRICFHTFFEFMYIRLFQKNTFSRKSKVQPFTH